MAEPRPVPVVESVLPKRDILKELLFAGLTALDNDHLTEPREGSAADYFGQVLDVDPDNAIALDGMRRLVARYMSLAERAYQNGALDVANAYLRKAEPYAIPADGLPALRQQWGRKNRVTGAPNNEFRLDTKALDARGDAIMLRLTEIAVKAMRGSSRITIVARSDAEGRWIYQQMREVLAEYRLRGNIVQGQVPKVILIDLPAH
ncbi:MAG TPA: hypothetical protein VLA24_07875 [Pseudomonadales bacterium]|nr:hypothetical protein [Pseudomonadales bacterium]